MKDTVEERIMSIDNDQNLQENNSLEWTKTEKLITDNSDLNSIRFCLSVTHSAAN